LHQQSCPFLKFQRQRESSCYFFLNTLQLLTDVYSENKTDTTTEALRLQDLIGTEDDESDADDVGDVGEELEDEAGVEEDMMDDVEELDGRAGSEDHIQGFVFDPATLGMKEINNLAHFGVSSHKPGNGVDELLDDDLDKYWQYVASPFFLPFTQESAWLTRGLDPTVSNPTC
jgi:hypothetical protein